MLVISKNIHIPARELQFNFAKSSGKGGQNVNKVNSKAILKFNLLWTISLPEDVKERALKAYAPRLNELGEITIYSDRHRSQDQNAKDCLQKLITLLTKVLHPPKERVATKPKYSSRVARLESKRRHARKKSERHKKRDWEVD